MLHNNTISVLIATKNRPKQLAQTLHSLEHSTILPSEIIIIDQSNNFLTKKIIKRYKKNKIVYIKTNTNGKSRALNLGISQASGNIFAFTDDDCIIEANWISEINSFFENYSELSLLFGKTEPFLPSISKNKNRTCLCTFNKGTNKISVTSKPGKHWEDIGYGNNMAIRASIFEKIGVFKTWLGPGSIGSNAEDAELTLRALIHNYKVGYSSSVIVFHNKWLNNIEFKKQKWSYMCGEMASYGWFALHGHSFAKKIISENIQNIIFRIVYQIKCFIKQRKEIEDFEEISIFNQITAYIKGSCVAVYFFIKK